jgi:hypothetical protein
MVGRAAVAGTVDINLILNTNGMMASSSSRSESMIRQEERVEMVHGNSVKISEVNVGGTPSSDGDWRTWAASAREKPMPITYELTSIVEVMIETVAQWYSDFVEFSSSDNETTPDPPEITRAISFGLQIMTEIPSVPIHSTP